MTDIMGLPAHPLFAHVPVVLIPLAALGVILMCWPKLRDRIGWFVVGILVIAGIATQLTISAGEDLQQYVHESKLLEDHTSMGENIRPWLLLMFLCVLGVMLVDRAMKKRAASAASAASGTSDSGDAGPDRLKIASTVLLALALVFSAMSTYWIYEIGHSGSKSVWHETQTRIDKGQKVGEHGGEGDEG
ncbi:MAG: DUF2231 domain-containing protein [Acidimicrobiia bacterium]